MKDCTTCKYGYEDERLGFPMCHHPKRFFEDCIDFNMHEEKEIKESEEPDKSLEEAEFEYAQSLNEMPANQEEEKMICDAFIAGADWQKERMGEQARKELAKTDITLADLVAFDEGLQLGRRLERQDMLKGAMEGYVNYYEDSSGILIAEAQVGCPYHTGDKVRIVVLKDEGK